MHPPPPPPPPCPTVVLQWLGLKVFFHYFVQTHAAVDMWEMERLNPETKKKQIDDPDGFFSAFISRTQRQTKNRGKKLSQDKKNKSRHCPKTWCGVSKSTKNFPQQLLSKTCMSFASQGERGTNFKFRFPPPPT